MDFSTTNLLSFNKEGFWLSGSLIYLILIFLSVAIRFPVLPPKPGEMADKT